MAGMRIGQLLVERGWVRREAIAEALAALPASGTRLCSLLIERGAVAFDDASRALGEQHASAAVMERHLERRDRSVEALLPARIARNLVAIPIGRLGSGALIVCVRDPARSTLAALTGVLGGEPVIAVAPARWVERLVAQVYAPRDSVDIPIDVEETPPPPAPVKSRPLSIVVPRVAGGARDSLDATLAAFRDIDDAAWLFDVAMAYVAKRWRSALLLELRDKRAVGVRGHGVSATAVRTFVIELAEVALVERARAERRLVDEVPETPGGEHGELVAVLGLWPVAAPLGSGDRTTHVLVVGDPLEGDREDASVDLGLLSEAMSEALARM
jgi:hypothetical protein